MCFKDLKVCASWICWLGLIDLLVCDSWIRRFVLHGFAGCVCAWGFCFYWSALLDAVHLNAVTDINIG